MSFNDNWDIDKYREEHESEEHWQLRKAFMNRWKDEYPEERLVCLAQVFANIEFMGCRYPIETMQEVARLSEDIACKYRKEKKTKLQRTFVSASDAAGDRAKGIKREGGVVIDAPSPKTKKIEFVKQGENIQNEPKGQSDDEVEKVEDIEKDDDKVDEIEKDKNEVTSNKNDENTENKKDLLCKEYIDEMAKVKCIDIRYFKSNMFQTEFGKFVLLIRSWVPKLANIQMSAQTCRLPLESTYIDNIFTLTLNGQLLARASSPTKATARKIVEQIAWNRLREESISLLVKEQWIAHSDKQISMQDVSGKAQEFGTPIESSVATKMMKLMGWKGGGLGADSQGIAEPIKPKLQMVNRAGLGSNTCNIHQLRRKGLELMRRFFDSEELDLDLVFSNEFSSDERSVLHMCAKKAGLASKSYGTDAERFLVVKKKLNVFSLVEAVVQKGGITPKHKVYIPAKLQHR